MHKNSSDILTIKKLKKDGSIDGKLLNQIAAHVFADKLVILPVDSIYGILATENEDHLEILSNISGKNPDNITRLISNFKMLEKISVIDKLEFDFLHRIWPGEMVVYLNSRIENNLKIPLQMPKGKLCQDLLHKIDKPLIFSPLLKPNNHLMYQKNMIIDSYKKQVDNIIIIDEFCKDHTLPTVLDICEDTLTILNEGRVSADEIKSLYFLGKDDSPE